MIELNHARLRLALHALSDGSGTPLLLLHALEGHAADWAECAIPWSGPVHALDFSGHGHSGRLQGGGYCAELWAADADVALAAVGGQAVVVGAGVGAYVALLLAGARPDAVHAAVLMPGPGLHGGGPVPQFGRYPMPPPARAVDRGLGRQPSVDPAVTFVSNVVRVPDYARGFALAARRLVLLEQPAQAWPAWWQAVATVPGVEAHRGGLSDALRALASQLPPRVRSAADSADSLAGRAD